MLIGSLKAMFSVFRLPILTAALNQWRTMLRIKAA